MNERIRELAEQAGATHKQNLGVYQFYADELEKFSELIVQECATICVNVSNTTRIDHTPHEGDVCSYNIKQHFGVE